MAYLGDVSPDEGVPSRRQRQRRMKRTSRVHRQLHGLPSSSLSARAHLRQPPLPQSGGAVVAARPTERAPPHPQLSALASVLVPPGSYLASSFEDTSEGATHWFQDEQGNLCTYTFDEKGAGTASSKLFRSILKEGSGVVRPLDNSNSPAGTGLELAVAAAGRYSHRNSSHSVSLGPQSSQGELDTDRIVRPKLSMGEEEKTKQYYNFNLLPWKQVRIVIWLFFCP